MAKIDPFETDSKGRPTSVTRATTSAGRSIYLIPIESFPGHRNNVYLIDDENPLLFDVGTRWSHPQLETGFAALKDKYGIATTLESLSGVIASHGHLDHFGNVKWFADRDIPVWVHELDARSLTSFSQHRRIASNEAQRYLARAGLETSENEHLIHLIATGTKYFTDISPVQRLRDGDTLQGMRVLHVPGHAPGMVCLGIDDVVLTADHLLSRISPVQSPQSLTPSTGLENYLRSLQRLREFGTFDLGLGAHEAPIDSVHERIDETVAHHVERLLAILEILDGDAATVADVARKVFGDVRGIAWLLAVFEAGAHIEYLENLGFLGVENESAILDAPDSAILYQAIEKEAARSHLATLNAGRSVKTS